MAICPYCNAEIHIKDFFEMNETTSKKGKIRRWAGRFTGEIIMGNQIVPTKMWACPACDKILGFTEYSRY